MTNYMNEHTILLIKSCQKTYNKFVDVYRRSNINRPVDDLARMQALKENSNLIVPAWDNDLLVGGARCFIDYGWVCYLSDLLVDTKYQNCGIGKSLIEEVRSACGVNCQLVLLSAPSAMEYYPNVGFEKANHAFFIKRIHGA